MLLFGAQERLLRHSWQRRRLLLQPWASPQRARRRFSLLSWRRLGLGRLRTSRTACPQLGRSRRVCNRLRQWQRRRRRHSGGCARQGDLFWPRSRLRPPNYSRAGSATGGDGRGRHRRDSLVTGCPCRYRARGTSSRQSRPAATHDHEIDAETSLQSWCAFVSHPLPAFSSAKKVTGHPTLIRECHCMMRPLPVYVRARPAARNCL